MLLNYIINLLKPYFPFWIFLLREIFPKKSNRKTSSVDNINNVSSFSKFSFSTTYSLLVAVYTRYINAREYFRFFSLPFILLNILNRNKQLYQWTREEIYRNSTSKYYVHLWILKLYFNVISTQIIIFSIISYINNKKWSMIKMKEIWYGKSNQCLN